MQTLNMARQVDSYGQRSFRENRTIYLGSELYGKIQGFARFFKVGAMMTEPLKEDNQQ